MIPTTDVQRGIWLTERADTGAGAFTMAVTVRFDGRLDVAALAAACDAVVARHGILGMAVAEHESGLALVPADGMPTLTEVEFYDGLVRDELARPFGPGRAPLIRFVLARQAPAQHLLLVVAHHVVFDGISKHILLRDLAAAYNAQTSGAPVAAAPFDAAAAITAVQERVAGELPAARARWRDHWQEPEPVVLPGLRLTPGTIGVGAEHQLVLDQPLCAALDRAATTIGVTRFDLLLAAVQALLYRYGGRTPTVAVDLSTRMPAIRDHVGPFVNELPVIASPLGLRSFRGFARAVHGALRELKQVRSVPLALAVPGLRPRAALAPVSVSYRRQDAEDPVFAAVAATVSWIVFPHLVRNALHLQMVDRDTSIIASLQYSTAALDAGAVARIATHLRTLLAAALADLEAPVATLPLLTGAEHRQVVSAGPRRAVDTTLMEMFHHQACATPDRIAVIHSGRHWRYGELASLVSGLAGRLRRSGVVPGDLVGVCLDRSVDALLALLAVAEAGAASVPIDPAYPPARRDQILADADPVLLLTSTWLAAEAGADRPVLTLDRPAALTLPAGGARPPAQAPASPPRDGDLAYIMYTSGSTGPPKGVAVPHHALANLLLAMREVLETRPDDVWLAHTSVSFDISALELFLPLVSGASLVLADGEEARRGSALLELIHKHGVTHVQATPSGWRMLLHAGLGAVGGELRSLVALAGGEALSATLARELRSRVQRLFNVYGPTETTIWSTLAEIPADFDEITIGRPIANTQVRILDGLLNPVPVGIPGELYIGGAGLACGYLGQPELTTERFVPDPHGPPGTRLYRTGDRASQLPDGSIVFHGRLDDQVKILGHRVEPGEVEARLLEHPAVAQAVVVARPDHHGQPVLVGYLVPHPGVEPPAPAELRALLARTLPASMLPGTLMALDRLPLTPNGKVDRAALPAPPASPPVEPCSDTNGADHLVDALRTIWRATLHVDHLGDEHDLFEFGGNSLTVIQLMDTIKAQLSVEVPLDAFYETPTIAGIAATIRQMSSTHDGGEKRLVGLGRLA